MRVLVTESDPGRGHEAIAELEAAGHEVVRCHEPGEPAFPCSAVSQRRCPLDEQTDAVLAVRAHPHPKPTPEEAGVSCALRADVPLVVAGSHGLSPFAEWATATVEDDADLAGAVEGAAATVPPAVLEAANAEARRLLGDGASVRGRRDGRRTLLQVDPGEDGDPERVAAAAVRVLDVARQQTTSSPVMDVQVARGDDPPGDAG